MSHAGWAAAAAILGLASYPAYVIPALRGRAQPGRVAWSIWLAEYAVLFAASLRYGWQAAALAGVVAAGSGVLAAIGWAGFLAGRPAAGEDLPGWLAWLLALLVTAALGAYLAVSSRLAIALAVGAELAGVAVSTRKAWRYPASESLPSWWLFACAAACGLAAAPRSAAAAYPVAGLAGALAVMGAAGAGGGRDTRGALRALAALTLAAALSAVLALFLVQARMLV